MFAPTNEAFDNLPAGLLESWFEPENRAQLRSIVESMVVAGRFTAVDLMERDSLENLRGEKLVLRNENGRLVVKDAAIVMPNIEAANGIIHGVDDVLRPMVVAELN